jgi:uncharacterized protein (DUF1501 family)
MQAASALTQILQQALRLRLGRAGKTLEQVASSVAMTCEGMADWPGLKDADLQDGRDLKPTTDLRAVLKGVLKDHVDDTALATRVFPDSAAVPPLASLVATA